MNEIDEFLRSGRTLEELGTLKTPQQELIDALATARRRPEPPPPPAEGEATTPVEDFVRFLAALNNPATPDTSDERELTP